VPLVQTVKPVVDLLTIGKLHIIIGKLNL